MYIQLLYFLPGYYTILHVYRNVFFFPSRQDFPPGPRASDFGPRLVEVPAGSSRLVVFLLSFLVPRSSFLIPHFSTVVLHELLARARGSRNARSCGCTHTHAVVAYHAVRTFTVYRLRVYRSFHSSSKSACLRE